MADQLTPQDMSWLEKFRQAAIEFRDALASLVSMQSYVQSRPALKKEYDGLMSTGSTIKATVEYITTTVDKVTGFFSNLFGLGNMPMYARPSSQLGVIPLIPIAMISGAVAVMGKWVRDVYLFERTVSEQKRLESRGLSPSEASAIVQGNSSAAGGDSLFGAFSPLIKPAAVLVGGLFLLKALPSLLSQRGSR